MTYYRLIHLWNNVIQNLLPKLQLQVRILLFNRRFKSTNNIQLFTFSFTSWRIWLKSGNYKNAGFSLFLCFTQKDFYTLALLFWREIFELKNISRSKEGKQFNKNNYFLLILIYPFLGSHSRPRVGRFRDHQHRVELLSRQVRDRVGFLGGRWTRVRWRKRCQRFGNVTSF